MRTPRRARRRARTRGRAGPAALAPLVLSFALASLLTGSAVGPARADDLPPSDPIPTITDSPPPTPSPDPSPTETPTPDPSPTDPSAPPPEPGPGGGGRGGGGPRPFPPPGGGGSSSGSSSGGSGGGAGSNATLTGLPGVSIGAPGNYSVPSGTYSTSLLDTIAASLEKKGWSTQRVIAAVYPPFILQGPAAWSDTWGAPRYGPAPGEVRTHEGQDVFCHYGAPVLAVEPGRIEFDTDALGGRIARLWRSDGSYWYYAHLSGWSKDIRSGSDVSTGQVIGFCGNSGDASGGAPHVHFGWYRADGVAMDPMAKLIGWLHEAEFRAQSIAGEKPPFETSAPAPGAVTSASGPMPADGDTLVSVTLVGDTSLAPLPGTDRVINDLALLAAALLLVVGLLHRRIWALLRSRSSGGISPDVDPTLDGPGDASADP